jgi:hypothetical protein
MTNTHNTDTDGIIALADHAGYAATSRIIGPIVTNHALAAESAPMVRTTARIVSALMSCAKWWAIKTVDEHTIVVTYRTANDECMHMRLVTTQNVEQHVLCMVKRRAGHCTITPTPTTAPHGHCDRADARDVTIANLQREARWWQEEAKHAQQALSQLKTTPATAVEVGRWAWQGDGADDLISMSDGMGISITAGQMKAEIECHVNAASIHLRAERNDLERRAVKAEQARDRLCELLHVASGERDKAQARVTEISRKLTSMEAERNYMPPGAVVVRWAWRGDRIASPSCRTRWRSRSRLDR